MKKHRALGSKRSNLLTLAILSFAINCSAAPTIANTTDVPAKISLNFLIGSCTDRISQGSDIIIAAGETKDFELDACVLTKIAAQIDVDQNDKWTTAATPYVQPTPWTGGDFQIVKDDKYKESGSGFGVEKI